ncbi:hypothetical protein FE772_17390 [Lysobacter enzymogenes]|nr:hypothetical protein [Lysobacter enzymogenes]QCW27146.1 hypothetical protein FE772_17390 [Lysobacter enzymogenes]
MAAAETTAPPARRSRKRLWIVLALLLAALLGLRWVSRPSQVGWIVLSQAGRALGLEISAGGASEYRLRGTPMLEVRDLVARVPAATSRCCAPAASIWRCRGRRSAPPARRSTSSGSNSTRRNWTSANSSAGWRRVRLRPNRSTSRA